MGSFSTPAVGGGPVIYAADLPADFSTTSSTFVDVLVLNFTLPWRANLLILPYIDYSQCSYVNGIRILYDENEIRRVGANSTATYMNRCVGFITIIGANQGSHTLKLQAYTGSSSYPITIKRPTYFRVLAFPA